MVQLIKRSLITALVLTLLSCGSGNSNSPVNRLGNEMVNKAQLAGDWHDSDRQNSWRINDDLSYEFYASIEKLDGGTCIEGGEGKYIYLDGKTYVDQFSYGPVFFTELEITETGISEKYYFGPDPETDVDEANYVRQGFTASALGETCAPEIIPDVVQAPNRIEASMPLTGAWLSGEVKVYVEISDDLSVKVYDFQPEGEVLNCYEFRETNLREISINRYAAYDQDGPDGFYDMVATDDALEINSLGLAIEELNEPDWIEYSKVENFDTNVIGVRCN